MANDESGSTPPVTPSQDTQEQNAEAPVARKVVKVGAVSDVDGVVIPAGATVEEKRRLIADAKPNFSQRPSNIRLPEEGERRAFVIRALLISAVGSMAILVGWLGLRYITPHAANAVHVATSRWSNPAHSHVVAGTNSHVPELRRRIKDLKEENRSLREQNASLLQISKALSEGVQNARPAVSPTEVVAERIAVASPPVENNAPVLPLPCAPCPSPQPPTVKKQTCPKVPNCTAISRKCDQDISDINISALNLKRALDVCLVEKRGLKAKLDKTWF